MTRNVPGSETRVNMLLRILATCDFHAIVAKGKEEALEHYNRLDSSNLDSGLQWLDSGSH